MSDGIRRPVPVGGQATRWLSGRHQVVRMDYAPPTAHPIVTLATG